MYFGFRNITIAYNGNTVLENISLEFRQGTINAIVGRNGSGKTSLLKTISGAVKPMSGAVVLEDSDLRTMKAKQRAKRIAYLPQMHQMLSDIDVRTLVSYGRFPYRKFGAGLSQQDKTTIDECLRQTELTDLAERSIQALSGGELQRAWIAMALAQQPQILVLDEPTTFLDLSYQYQTMNLIRKLNREMGITVVMVLHDLNLASAFADSITVLGNRQVLAQGNPKQVVTQQNLLNLFGIKAKVDDAERPHFIPETDI